MNAWLSAASRYKAFFLVVFLFPQNGWAARTNTSIRAFNEGVKLFNAKQFREAIPHFDDAISDDPNFADSYFARGACRYYLQSMDGALVDLNDAMRLKPDYWQARALRGAVNYETDRWDAALDDFNAVLKQDPHDAQSLLGRAVILLKRDNLTGAARDFRGFLSVRPDDPLAPKVKEILASLKRAPGEPPFEGGETPVPVHHRHRSPAMENLQHMADSFLSSPLTESYSRQVLRGEKVQSVGDIHTHPGVPKEEDNSNSDVEIVDPH